MKLSLSPDVKTVVVRMCRDPLFLQAVLTSPDTALAEYSLEPEERQAIINTAPHMESPEAFSAFLKRIEPFAHLC